MTSKKTVLTTGLALFATAALARSYSIDRFTIAGGGGTSTGGVYAVSGTIGQPEAAWPLDKNGFAVRSTSGNYTLVGGFWSVIQQDGLPPLSVERRAGGFVLSWPDWASGVAVQSATQLAPGADWTEWGGSPVRIGDHFEVNLGAPTTPPDPIRFFRLHRP